MGGISMDLLDNHWSTIRSFGRSLANQYAIFSFTPMDTQEIDQESYLAAAEYLKTYDPNRGASPRTWAWYGLRRHFGHARVKGYDETIDLPILSEHEQDILDILGEEGNLCLSSATLDELNTYLDHHGYRTGLQKNSISVFRRHGALLIRASFRVVAKEISTDPEDYSFTSISVESDDETVPIANHVLALSLEASLCKLPPSKRLIIRLTYGLGCPTRSPKEIAEQLGISDRRVVQIQKESLNQLRDIILKGLV